MLNLNVKTGWQHAYDRLDVELSGGDLKEAVMRSLEDAPSEFAERKVESVETLDGVKLNLGGNAWILFRPSGTEPLLRVYCEAPSEGEVAEYFSRRRRRGFPRQEVSLGG